MAEGLSLRHGLDGLGQAGRTRRLLLVWRVPLALGALAGAISAALLWLGPPGNDTAAHVYQLRLYQHHGLTPWDNYWYSGRWVFVTYSLALLPTRRSRRDQAARGPLRCDGRRRFRAPRAVDAGCGDVRGRLGRVHDLGRVPVHARRRASRSSRC